MKLALKVVKSDSKIITLLLQSKSMKLTVALDSTESAMDRGPYEHEPMLAK
jgi:hypothetical protein